MNAQEEISFLNRIIDEILAVLEEVLSSGEEIPDELAGAIAEEIEYSLQRIQQLESELSSVPSPQLQPGPYPSSNVNSFSYDPKNKKLFVKFHGEKTANSGPTYKYDNVPEFIYEVFRRGAVGPRTSGKNKYHEWHRNIMPSLGAAMNSLVKAGGYPFHRIA